MDTTSFEKKSRLKAIYVDNEQKHLDVLENILSQHPGFEYLGGFDNAPDGLQYLKTHEVDVLFLDVEMPGYDGLWLAEQVKELNVAVIFTTAYTKYATAAFEACAIDYLVKPVHADDINRLLERINLREQKMIFSNEQLCELKNQYTEECPVPQRIFINFIGKIDIANLSDILYFKGVDGYTHIVMKDGTRHVSSKSLKIYTDAIDRHPDFLRVHRSALINKNYAVSIVRESNDNKYSIRMTNGDALEISKFKKDELIEALMK